MDIRFGRNIAHLREFYGLTQANLAAKLRYSTHSIIARWERGDIVPPAKTLTELSSMFNVSVDDLLYSDLAQDDRFVDLRKTALAGLKVQQTKTTVMNTAPISPVQTYQLSDDEVQLIAYYRKMDDGKKSAIRTLLGMPS